MAAEATERTTSDHCNPKISRACSAPPSAESSGGSNDNPDVTQPMLRWPSRTSLVVPELNAPLASNDRDDTRKLPGEASTTQPNASGVKGSLFWEVPSEEPPGLPSLIDPLSQHIIKRTQVEKIGVLKLRGSASLPTETGGADGASRQNVSEHAPPRGDTVVNQKQPKEKRKGVSFLSRFIGNSKEKDRPSDGNDNTSDLDGTHSHGTGVEVFAHPIGFIPRFPPPPKYIKVRAHYKKQKTFDRVFLAQELRSTYGPAVEGDRQPSVPNEKAIWALEFSKDGRYLAAAGQDRIVRVWVVITSQQDREAHELEEDEAKSEQQHRLRPTAPVFKSKPIREYEGHMGSVLGLNWSKNNFLLSSSMDRTVRLWHVSRLECLCCFKHSDLVTSIQFHPRDDRFFLAGSLDSRLRLWSIPDKSVAFWAVLPDMITAVAFTPDGRYSIAGCLNGLCNLYETNGLKATGQIPVRSARGRNAKGSKITGIDAILHPPDDPNGETKLLITSNDSRIRLYNFKDHSLEAKYRGNENTTSQIRASFSDDGKHIICGSEDCKTYVWSTSPSYGNSDKRAVEVLETRTAVVTSAIMAPTKTKQLLGYSGDLLYDLCNPPRITLVSRADSVRSSKPETRDIGRVQDNNKATQGTAETKVSPEEQTPAYLARSTHTDGNIIVVADYLGRIKVFRQDCAYHKRPIDTWDPNLSLSKKLIHRSNSARQSVASSIGKDSTSKTPSERILAWRSSVIGIELASIDSHGGRARSTSPRKSLSRVSRHSSLIQSAAGVKMGSGYASPRSRSASSRESLTNSRASTTEEGLKLSAPAMKIKTQAGITPPFILGQQENASEWLEDGQSRAFWTNAMRAAQAAANSLSVPDLNDPSAPRQDSIVPSILSDDLDSVSGNGGADENEEVLRCTRCRSTNFQATRIKTGKPQRLICGRCGMFVT